MKANIEDDLTPDEWLAWQRDWRTRWRRRIAVAEVVDFSVDFSDLEAEAEHLRRVRDAYRWLGKWAKKNEDAA